MPRRPPNAVVGLAIAIAIAATLSTPARAGQVRIDVGAGDGFQFLPASPQLNQGDHVVWVWVSGSHSVTSGTGCSPAATVFDAPTGSSTRFSWKSDRSGSVPYVCRPHCGMMAGSITMFGSGIAVSDFRITEAHFAIQGFIEIANIGSVAGNLGQYRLSIDGAAALLLPQVDIDVPAGGRVTVHLNETGANSNTQVYFQGLTLPRSGSAALYVPNTVNASLTAADMMADFVQWGAGGEPLEDVADAANYWTPGDFVEVVADGRSIAYCPTTPGQRGADQWLGIAVPTPGSVDCTTPVLATSWGRLKILHR
jgi:plastocyanin